MEGQTDSGYFLKRIGHAATHPNVPDVLTLKKDVTSFGRLTANDHFLDSAVLNCMISRRHAEIRKVDGHPEGSEYELVDHSLNGTYVNDRRVDGRCALHVGDVLKFGHMNGVNIKPGQHAPQPNTEFVFQFSKDDGPKPLHIPTTNGTDTTEISTEVKYNRNVKRRASSSSSSSIADSPAESFTKIGKKRERTDSVSSASGDEKSPGLAGTHMFSNETLTDSKNITHHPGTSSDSEDGMFVDAEDKSPSSLNSSANTQKKKPSIIKTPKGPAPAKKKKVAESISAAVDIKKARRASKSNKQPSKSDDTPGATAAPGSDEWWYYHSDDDKCAALQCRRPGQNEVIDWVACDDCDQWWHTYCAGVTSQQIKKKSFQYHCGCANKKKPKKN